jgi:hypothetical protein
VVGDVVLVVDVVLLVMVLDDVVVDGTEVDVVVVVVVVVGLPSKRSPRDVFAFELLEGCTTELRGWPAKNSITVTAPNEIANTKATTPSTGHRFDVRICAA